MVFPTTTTTTVNLVIKTSSIRRMNESERVLECLSEAQIWGTCTDSLGRRITDIWSGGETLLGGGATSRKVRVPGWPIDRIQSVDRILDGGCVKMISLALRPVRHVNDGDPFTNPFIQSTGSVVQKISSRGRWAGASPLKTTRKMHGARFMQTHLLIQVCFDCVKVKGEMTGSTLSICECDQIKFSRT